MENKQSQKENIISENKGRGLFYVVIAVATFIIMAVGATFAYFTATTNSFNSAVKAGSTTLQLEYISYGAAWMTEELIPANDTVVEYSFEMQNDTTITNATTLSNTLCRDDYGNAICSIYVFQVKNKANSPQSVSIDVVSESNGFESLHAMAYEIAVPTTTSELEIYNNTADGEGGVANPNGDGDPVFNTTDQAVDGVISVVDGKNTILTQYSPVYVNRKGVVKKLLQWVESTDEVTQVQVVKPAINRLLKQVFTEEQMALSLEDRMTRVADNVEIPGNDGMKTFALVLYIKNKENENQTEKDADKDFVGRVIVGSGDGNSGVSGTIGLSGDYEDQLQSKNQNQEEPDNGGDEPNDKTEPTP